MADQQSAPPAAPSGEVASHAVPQTDAAAPEAADHPAPAAPQQPAPPLDNAGPSAPPLPPLPPDQEEDPLMVAQREQEEREAALREAADIQPSDDPALKAFYSDMREVDRENEVNRILGAFKLNPFEMLGLRFDAAPEEIPRAYRKVSLAVHPDKCSHPRAKDAFETIGHAQKELMDEEKRRALDFLLGVARDEVRKEWKKAAKHDAAARVAALIDVDGREGVAAAYESTPEFHEAWKAKARDVLAKTEWRKRKMGKRMVDEEARAKEEFKVQKEESKKKREHDKAWESSRDARVGTWRDFMSTKSKKTKGGSAALGGLKPPKAKTSDEDKRYVQRAVGEQFRPAQVKRG